MSLGLSSHISCTRLAIFLDKFAESGPGIVAMDEVDSLILTGMSGEDMIMLVVEDSELEVVSVGNIDVKLWKSGPWENPESGVELH